MLDIKKTYVTDSKNRPLAVQVDIKTFERIEQVLEDYALGKLIEEKGDAALAAISDPKGEFIDRKRALYVFVYDKNIVVLAHPYRHELIGQCLKGKPDDEGRMFRDEIVNKALTKGSGWTEYVYQLPPEVGGKVDQITYRKYSYGKLFTHGNKKYIVCSGTYEYE